MSTPTSYKPKLSPRELSKRMFFLAGYSLTGAALMGSSIGLVIYQSRQFYFLHRFSRSDGMNPYPHHHDRFNNETLGQDQGLSSTDPSPFAHGQYPRHRFHGGRHHHRLQALFFSTWLPILVWFGSLLTSSALIAARKWVPKGMSARTGVLVSQCTFALFWILLGAMQEVQERLVAQRRAARTMDPIAEAMDDTNQFDATYDLKEQIRAMILPLCTMWYLTVILLGSATGLLTASSSLLERQLQSEYDEALLDEENDAEELLVAEEKMETTTTIEGGVCPNEMLSIDDTKQPLAVLTHREDSGNRNVFVGSLSRYTTTQRVQLCLLMFVLFMSQMKLFQWIIQAQSMQAFLEGTSTSVSLTLTLVGLFSGTLMTTLGIRFLPRTAATSA
ncbi:hypothetical protein BGZ95_012143 [Linnemannia exigua]|uniref:Transmembrane protein n=1 Tax=Linnemannia exigua TaxID=604196 RepID=A0AAD4DJI6_9FUNG|nr:hypothetical protein BGZ95_012143 [Linnemannia exigua]